MSDLHYTKSGALDMRYSSSRAAVASGYSSSYSTPSYGSSSSSGLHYTKSGALDMRYNSSRAAVAAGYYVDSASSPTSYTKPTRSSRSTASDLHYTKSGALDMRYNSSREVVAQAAAALYAKTSDSNLHYTKSGALDMRYNSSREVVAIMENLALNTKRGVKANNAAKAPARMQGVPSNVPVTKAGAPDLRTTKAKDWVQSQARRWHPADDLPAWIPCLKDGSPDMTKAVARHFIGGSPALAHEDKRDDYYKNKCLEDRLFERLMQQQREMPVEMISEPEPVRATAKLREAFATVNDDAADDSFMPKSSVTQLDFDNDLAIDEDAEPLGHGGFGTVYKGKWDSKEVAIKKLHAAKLTKKERKMFIRETLILGMLGDHPNIVQLHGYTLNPVSLVMEYVPKGSLSYLLHYCEDPKTEAKMTDGRVKLNILLGIAYGMAQLHECNVTHGDLKPQNVLITDDFHAKIADFGLATFRAKAASTTSSSTIANEKTDVYSFGVLMNEVLHEEEPYQQNLRQFVGKGPFAAVLFAKEGNRPQIRDKKVTPELKGIIEQCWSQRAGDRPTFTKVAKLLSECQVLHAC
ncbi:TKL protein kinase [Phytophthora cinnamomi]|uniref:TKL protein kinase n=1 Tax=Phytophthora cinnamomi TaxID=4785 RepID=UPI00355994E1|nr:TKL protein kinase [Phytophthora cinnamomi]